MNTCPKCGSDNLNPTFMPVEGLIRMSEVTSTQKEYVDENDLSLHAVVTKEHLSVVCTFCGYKFAMQTKDHADV